ncbi:MAG: hypothetical protein ACP5N0_02465 [Methanosarcina sp.]
MYCDQCTESLSGKGYTKNGSCKKHRDEPSITEIQGKEGRVSVSARLKHMMGFSRKKVKKR